MFGLTSKDGSHGWYMYHLLGLPDDRSAGAFKELSGNVAQLAHGATVESDESVHPSDALGASFGQTIKNIGGGIFKICYSHLRWCSREGSGWHFRWFVVNICAWYKQMLSV